MNPEDPVHDLPTLSPSVHDELIDILFGARSARSARLQELLARPGVDAAAVQAHVAFHADLDQESAVEDARSSGSDGAPIVGGRFGRYRILERIKEGGMGTVFLAADEQLHRNVALKVIRPDCLARPGARERFRREARAVAGLRHSGICAVYEVGAVEEVPFLAMEFIDGSSLSAVLAARRRRAVEKEAARVASLPSTHRDLSEILHTIELVAEALHAAHEAGIVHRDVKPGNILIDRAGRPILIDFGLAREPSTAGEPTLTGVGDLLGTPPYMSPEQVRPRGRIDGRTDVYSLAVTLYECLTLQHPFVAGDQLSLFEHIERGATPDPRRLNPALPADLAAVLAKAMEKEPARRYPSALAFADDLRRVRTQQPTMARRIGPFGRLLRWCRRNRLAAGVGLAMACAVLVIGALLEQSVRQRTQLESRTREAAAHAVLGAAAFEQDLHPNLSLHLACRGYEAMPGPAALEQVRSSLAACAERATLRGHGHLVTNSALARDGSLAITGSYDGTVRTWGRNGEPLRSFEVGDNVTDLRFADGTKSALVTTAYGGNGPNDPPRGRALRLDLASGGLTVLDAGPAPRFAIAQLPRNRVAIATAEGALRIVGDDGTRDYPHGATVWKLCVSPLHPHLVATCDYARTVRVFDVDRADPTPILQLTTPAYVDGLQFSPTRDELLIGDYSGRVLVAPVDGGATTAVLHGASQGAQIRQVCWSHDGNRFLTIGDDGRGFLWSREGALQAVFTGHVGPVYCCVEMPGGAAWATGGDDATIRLWSDRGLQIRELRGHASAISGGLSFSDDCTTLLSAATDSTARIWDLSSERAVLLRTPNGSGLMTVQAVPGAERNRVVATTVDGHVVQWDDAGLVADLPLPKASFTGSAVFLPDGKLIVGQFGGFLHVVDLASGKVLRAWHAEDEHDTAARMIQVLGDGDLLVVQQMWGGYPAAVRRVSPDLGNQRLVVALPADLIVQAFVCDRDGARVFLACGDGSVRVVHDGAVDVVVPPTDAGILAIALSPDGHTLATGGTEMIVRLYAVGSSATEPLRELRTLRGHQGDILRIRFAADGKRFVSSSRDRTARVWSLDGSPLATLRGHPGFVYDACWSADGRRLLTAGYDGSLRSWIDDPDELLAHARLRQLPLADEEVQPYLDLLKALDAR